MTKIKNHEVNESVATTSKGRKRSHTRAKNLDHHVSSPRVNKSIRKRSRVAAVLRPTKEDEHDGDNDFHDIKKLAERQKHISCSALKGKRLAVSTRLESSAKSNTTTTQILSYNQLKDLVAQTGGIVSSQVNKRIHAVIASQEAVELPATQRVRKAWKLNIPVVSIDWIRQCLQTRQCLSLDDSFCYPPPTLPQLTVDDDDDIFNDKCREERKKCSAVPETIKCEVESPSTEIQIDLGCCCVCHDSVAPNVATDCPWCIECSVNKAAAVVATTAEPEIDKAVSIEHS